MKRYVLTAAALMVMAGLSFSSCKKARELARKAKRSVAVDCNQMCDRAFKECLVDYMVYQKEDLGVRKVGRMLKKGGKKVADRIRKSDQADMLVDKCVRQCQKKRGISGAARKLNKCLDEKGCESFAKCLAETHAFSMKEWLGKIK